MNKYVVLVVDDDKEIRDGIHDLRTPLTSIMTWLAGTLSL